MKKLAFLLSVIFLMSTAPAFAHCGMCGIGEAKGEMAGEMTGDMADKKVEKMKEELGLSDEQAAQVKALVEKKIAAKQKAQDDFKAGLDAILTDEQKAKKMEMKEEHMEKGSKGSKGSHHDHGDGHEHTQ